MNIFAIDHDPAIAAKHLVDSHCIKMVLESSQMLANCFSPENLASENCPKTQKGTVRSHTHLHHPCSKWVKQSRENMRWLIKHAYAMDEERVARFESKPHFSISFIKWCDEHIDLSPVPEGKLTNFAQAMPEEFKDKCSIVAYRKFYKYGKVHLHQWKRNKPMWIFD